jgi:RimJ/RimL family protein N-acetyltransferase
MTVFDRIAPETLRDRSTPRLCTERLILRAPRLEDAKTIAALVNDRRIAENTLRIPYPYGIADAQAFITGANANSGETVFLITERGTTVLGACGIAEQRAAPPEIGYWLAVPFWGRGYATEAARAMVDYAFEHLGHELLHAGARVTNAASRRCWRSAASSGRGLASIASNRSPRPRPSTVSGSSAGHGLQPAARGVATRKAVLRCFTAARAEDVRDLARRRETRSSERHPMTHDLNNGERRPIDSAPGRDQDYDVFGSLSG